jgi:hypothetical protein
VQSPEVAVEVVAVVAVIHPLAVELLEAVQKTRNWSVNRGLQTAIHLIHFIPFAPGTFDWLPSSALFF